MPVAPTLNLNSALWSCLHSYQTDTLKLTTRPSADGAFAQMEMFSAFWNILPLPSSMLTQENTDSPSVQLNLVWAFLFYALIGIG